MFYLAQLFQVWMSLATILGQWELSLISRGVINDRVLSVKCFILLLPSSRDQQLQYCSNSYFIFSTLAYLQTVCYKFIVCLYSPLEKWYENERQKLLLLSLFFCPEWDCSVCFLTYATNFGILSPASLFGAP